MLIKIDIHRLYMLHIYIRMHTNTHKLYIACHNMSGADKCNVKKKIKLGGEYGVPGGSKVAVISVVVRKGGLTEKVTYQRSPKNI